jgi:hypothetical protein
MEEIKVLVPEDRVSEFYRWFADWSDGVLERKATQAPDGAGVERGQLTAATEFWRSLRPKERAVWNLWINASPRMLRADEIVRELGLNGPRDIPGTLSWSTRKASKVGFHASWRFRTDPVTEEPIYGIEDVEYAKLLGRARDAAEGGVR